jgi:hypothetical protein
MTCTACREERHGLQEREYRRVAGMVLVSAITTERGRYCAPCRRRVFRRNMMRTLLFGWWGFEAMFRHNPAAIRANLK